MLMIFGSDTTINITINGYLGQFCVDMILGLELRHDPAVVFFFESGHDGFLR